MRRHPCTWAIVRSLARVALVALFLLAVFGSQAIAADFVVTKTVDTNDGACDADCSLREAIVAANTSPGPDRVILSAGLTFTLSLGPADAPDALVPASGDLDIIDALTIEGSGSTIDAAGVDRALDIRGNFPVTINNLTVSSGVVAGFLSFGGGIFIGGGAAVTLHSSTVANNSTAVEAGARDDGGGLAVVGVYDAATGSVTPSSLTLISTTVSNNTGLNGGGILCVLCSLTLLNSTIAGNAAEGTDGGGIVALGNASTLSITRSNLVGNTVLGGAGRGGALSVPFGSSTSTLTRNRIVANMAAIGAAIFNSVGTVSATDNWWGCNFGPGAGGLGCASASNSTAGAVVASPYLVFRLAADPAAIAVGGVSVARADLIFNSSNADTSAAGTVPDGITIGFAATLGTFVTPSLTTSNGRAANVFTGTAPGSASVSATVDAQTVSTSVAIAHTTFTTLAGTPPSPVFVQTAVVLTATVISADPAAGTPAGSVAFRDGATPLPGCGSVALNGSGMASCSIPGNTLPAGEKSFVAEYAGTASHFPSTGALNYTYTNPVARTPSITNAVTGVNRQTTSGLVVSRNPADGPEVTHFKVTDVSGGALFLNDGTTPIGVGSFITVAQGNAGLRFTPALNSLVTGHVTVRASLSASDAGLGGGSATADIIVTSRVVTTGTDAPGGPLVRRYRGGSGDVIDGPTSQFYAFAESFTGGVRVADADLTGDGVADVIAGTGPGVAPRVVVFNGATGAVVRDLVVGFPGSGGVFVAAGDVDGDGWPDLIAGDGGDSTLVHVFSGASGVPVWNTSIADPAFAGGVRVASGDIDGDGYADVIVGSGPGAASRVRVFSGATRAELRSFAPYVGFAGGVWVAAGDVNGDGYSDVITGADAGGGPHVRVFDGPTGVEQFGFFAAAPTFTGGVRVAAGDVNGDEHADVITGLGPGGALVQVFDGVTGALIGIPTVVTPPDGGALFVSTAVPTNRMVIEGPAAGATLPPDFRLHGWAFQEGAPGTGVDTIHVWAYPAGGAAPVFLGAATMGDSRPDVGAIFGARYASSGYHLDVTGLANGTYDIVAYAHHSATGVFNMRRVVRVRILAPGTDVQLQVDAPAAGAVRPNVRVAGWAFDIGAVTGSGIEAVHVWAFPAAGGTASFLGAASLGDARPDVEAVFGPRASHAGYHLDVVGLPAGDYVLGVYAKAFAAASFTVVRTVAVTVTPWAPTEHLFIDLPSTGPVPSGDFVVAGWAVAVDGPSTPGIAAVHVWAYPVGGGGPSFLGAATLGGLRPDVAAIFGPGYETSGYGLQVIGLPSGTWDIAVFPLAESAAAFGPARVVRITVP